MVNAKYPPEIVLFVIVRFSSPPVNILYEVGEAEHVIGILADDVDCGASMVHPVIVMLLVPFKRTV
jgi:hypothetical protein